LKTAKGEGPLDVRKEVEGVIGRERSRRHLGLKEIRLDKDRNVERDLGGWKE